MFKCPKDLRLFEFRLDLFLHYDAFWRQFDVQLLQNFAFCVLEQEARIVQKLNPEGSLRVHRAKCRTHAEE